MSKSDVAKPVRLEVLGENIPERIRSRRRWVVWRWCRRNTKWDKPPRQTNGDLASVDDPAMWCSFDEAMEALRAEQTGRKAFLMELDPLYCDVIVQRYEQFTGQKAERQAALADAVSVWQGRPLSAVSNARWWYQHDSQRDLGTPRRSR